MKHTFVEVSSGFANVENSVIPIEEYSSYLQNRSGSAYDKYHTVELPEGITVEHTTYGEYFVYDEKHEKIIEPYMYGKNVAIIVDYKRVLLREAEKE